MADVAESPFEAEFLGGPAWRLTLHRPSDAAEAAAAARDRAVRLVSCRISATAPAGDLRALEAAGFRLIERLVTLSRPIAPAGRIDRRVGPAGEADGEACARIAVAALRQDRYHADPLIGDETADAIKAAWARNNAAGRAQTCLVARDPQGDVVGFNQLLLRDREAIIDLIAVDPGAHRKGYGRALVEAGLRACGGSADVMRVGTQATNLASLALYRSVGFEVLREELTFHLTSRV